MIRSKTIPLRSLPHELVEGILGVSIVIAGSVYFLNLHPRQIQDSLYKTFAPAFGHLPVVFEVYLYHFILLLSILSTVMWISSILPLTQNVAIFKRFCYIVALSQLFLTPLKLFSSYNRSIPPTCVNINALIQQTQPLLQPCALSTFLAPKFLSPTGTIQLHSILPMIKHSFDIIADYFVWVFTRFTYNVLCNVPSFTIFLTILSTTVWFYLFGNFYINSITFESNEQNTRDDSLNSEPGNFHPILSAIQHVVSLTIMFVPIYLIISPGHMHPIDSVYSILVPVVFIWTDRYALENLYCNSVINFVITHPEQYNDFVLSLKGTSDSAQVDEHILVQRPIVACSALSALVSPTPPRKDSFMLNSPEPPTHPLPPLPSFHHYVDDALFDHEGQAQAQQRARNAALARSPPQIPQPRLPGQDLFDSRRPKRHTRSSSSFNENDLPPQAILTRRVSSRRMSISRPNDIDLDQEIMSSRPRPRTRSKSRKLDLDTTL